MEGYMYILECSDGTYYTGSTNNLELRLHQHLNGEGAVYTRTRLPVKLLCFEQFSPIDDAFFREKQVQGLSRKKKEALINDMLDNSHDLAKCMNDTSHVGYAKLDVDSGGFGSAQPPD